ncbi:hypothetical protein CHS0354_003380 [Potamilus streckersoni]|uniref:Uncharacterized protein n=1 Tax=Potamilus streckersoni TaxID=2493646 RepID=A0AAE0SUM1_9BIVA|nr:hypothetical protein CHS0354_003380 [Potamilus streckersoni]
MLIQDKPEDLRENNKDRSKKFPRKQDKRLCLLPRKTPKDNEVLFDEKVPPLINSWVPVWRKRTQATSLTRPIRSLSKTQNTHKT